MAGKSKHGRQMGKGLTTEEANLWRLVTDTVRPLEGRANVLSGDVSMDALMSGPVNEVSSQPVSAQTSFPDSFPKKTPVKAFLDAYHPPVSKPQSAPKTPLAGQEPIDRKTKRKIAKGSVPLGARIDLHGMTQDEAYSSLISFVRSSSFQGHRHVLVITGKGLSKQGQGVLRQAVPKWLSTPPLSALVNGFEWAAIGHGGGGALYVRLRNLSKPGKK